MAPAVPDIWHCTIDGRRAICDGREVASHEEAEASTADWQPCLICMLLRAHTARTRGR